MGSDLDELVGIAGEYGDVGEHGESWILTIAEHADQRFVLLVLRYLHEQCFDQLHIVLNELSILAEDGWREQVFMHGVLREDVHQLGGLLSISQEQVEALEDADRLGHIGLILQHENDEAVLAEGDEELLCSVVALDVD